MLFHVMLWIIRLKIDARRFKHYSPNKVKVFEFDTEDISDKQHGIKPDSHTRNIIIVYIIFLVIHSRHSFTEVEGIDNCTKILSIKTCGIKTCVTI